MKNTQTNKQKGYIIKDTITNNQTGQIQVYFTGVDGYVQDEAKYCEPYKKKGCALNNVRKSAYYWDKSKKEGDDFLNYIEGGRWVHQVEIIEVNLNEPNTKQLLENIKADLEKECNDISLDFVGDYSLEDIRYLSDCFNEFADGQISVYYSDQLSELLEGCEDYNLDQGCELLDLVKERVEKGE